MNQNRFPLWKNLLVLGVVVLGAILALPNVFGSGPAVQVGRVDRTELEAGFDGRAAAALSEAGIETEALHIRDGRLVARFTSLEDQERAYDVFKENFDQNQFVAATTLEPRAPLGMRDIGLEPMNLGLDLRGGVHFLYQVDMAKAIEQSLTIAEADFKRILRDAEADYRRIEVEGSSIRVRLRDPADLDRAEELITKEEPRYDIRNALTSDGEESLLVSFSDELLVERQDNAIKQNIITIRNRVNELGVAEPLVQRQGVDRIVVQLPGMNDPAYAKKILSATATVEFRGEFEGGDPFAAERSGRAPPGSLLYVDRETQRPALLKRSIIASGENLTDASQGFDSQSGSPSVNVKLDARGAKRMLDYTKDHVNKRMGAVYIDNKVVGNDAEGNPVFETREEIISLATIRGVFSSNFQITGLATTEAQELALLLRAGSLAAPITIVEERTVGPSLGQDNIDRGFNAIKIGFLLVVIFMLVYYRLFGVFANLALLVNVVMIVAVLSLLDAALTLPGIAGIVLTVGMAVDANVLIFERIREELRNGNSPQASIHAGYEKAFSSIADANITTFIAAIVLFFLGTGPIKGFAIVLAIGIATSMFTAIVGTRALANLVYGGRKQLASISI